MTLSSWAGHLHWWWFSRSVVADSCDPQTVAHQGPLSLRYSRQEYWSGLPFPSPGDLPDAGVEPGSSALQADSLPTEPQGKPSHHVTSQQQQVAMKANGVLKLTLNPLFNLLSKPVFPTFPSSPHPCFWDPERSHPTEAFSDTVWSSVREKCEFRTDFAPVFLRVDDTA